MIDKDLIRNKISNIEDLPNTTILKTLNDFEKRIDNVVKGVVDDAPSLTSENPLQNKVVTMELNNKVNYSDIPTQQEKEFLSGEYDKSKNLFNADEYEKDWSTYYLPVKKGATIGVLAPSKNANTVHFWMEQYNESEEVLHSSNYWWPQRVIQLDSECVKLKFATITNARTEFMVCYANSVDEIGSYQPYNGAIVHEKDLGELLWENASPNAEFAAQTISCSITKNSHLTIYYKNYKSGDMALMEHKVMYNGNANEKGYLNLIIGTTSVTNKVREYTLNTTGIAFADNYDNGGVYNTGLIPVKITISRY